MIWSETEPCMSLDCKKFWCKPWIISYGNLYLFKEDCKLIKRNLKLQSQSVYAWHTHSPRRRELFVLRELLFLALFHGSLEYLILIVQSQHQEFELMFTIVHDNAAYRLYTICLLYHITDSCFIQTQMVSNFVKYLFVIKITSEKELE